MKNVYLLVYVVISYFTIISCGARYIQEIPFKLRYDEEEMVRKLGIDDENSSDSEGHEYEEPLTDKEMYLKEKYSAILEVLPTEVTNYAFYGTIDEWLGTPYAKKGISHDSLNIAAFTQLLYKEAFDRNVPPNPSGIFQSKEIELFKGRRYLKEGDVVFFRYHKDNPVSDVGIYMQNDRILASTYKNGLAIFDFNTEYFQIRYLCAGRLTEKEDE